MSGRKVVFSGSRNDRSGVKKAFASKKNKTSTMVVVNSPSKSRNTSGECL